MDEKVIWIGDHQCSQGEAMFLRVAMTSFVEEMSRKGILGDDETGESIRQGYLLTGRRLLDLFSNYGDMMSAKKFRHGQSASLKPFRQRREETIGQLDTISRGEVPDEYYHAVQEVDHGAYRQQCGGGHRVIRKSTTE